MRRLRGQRRRAAAIAGAVFVGLAVTRLGAAQPIPGFVSCNIKFVGVQPSAIAAGDFNSDGNPDLALADGTNGQVVIALTDRASFAAGDCTNATTTNNIPLNSAGLTSIAVGNLDPKKSLALDLVVGVQAGALILRGDGNGGFTANSSALAAGSDPQAVAINDVDGDGIPDIVVGNGNGQSVSILYGRSDGSYDRAMSLPVTFPVTFMVVQDLNGDGHVDIAAGSRGSTIITVFLQNPSDPRSFPMSPSFPEPANALVAPTAMVAGDFNGDGKPDLAVTSGATAGKLTLFRNQLPDMNKPFVQEQMVDTGASPSALGTDDFNGDFALDVVVANQGDSSLPFFLGNGDGGLTEMADVCGLRSATPGPCVTGAGPRGLVLADVDGDGHSDVITANQDGGSISVFLSSRPLATPTSIPTTTPTVTPTPTSTNTVTPTATTTQTATSTSTVTVTRTPQMTFTPTVTPTSTPQCFGSVCVQGSGCVNVAPGRTSRGSLWLLAPALLWLMYQRWRRE